MVPILVKSDDVRGRKKGQDSSRAVTGGTGRALIRRAVKRAGPSKKVWCSRLGSTKTRRSVPIGHVRYINIQAWLRGFRVKIANFSSFLCPSIPKRDLDTKKTTPNIEVWPESLGAMLEYWYIERGLWLTVELRFLKTLHETPFYYFCCIFGSKAKGKGEFFRDEKTGL